MALLLQSLKPCNIKYLPSLYHLNVRWTTKPRWVPIAKSKMFRVTQRPVYEPEEAAELKRLDRNYRTHIKSIKKLFDEVYQANETSDEVIQKFEQEKEDAWNECMILNNKWNEQVAIERVQRDAEQLENEIQAAREDMRVRDELEKKRLEDLEELIRQEKEASKHYITQDNIDETVEKILSSPPHTFNFAIDRDGRKYSGLSATPDIESEIETMSAESNKASSSMSE